MVESQTIQITEDAQDIWLDDLIRQPTLHPPGNEPDRHWKTVDSGTVNEIVPRRRKANELLPTDKAEGYNRNVFGNDPSDDDTEQGPNPLEDLRAELRDWRDSRYPGAHQVTRNFLEHLASGQEREARRILFFAQREAVETIIYLTECCSPEHRMRIQLQAAAREFNEGLMRLALRMATGTGKTAVMACMIAWYAINRGRTRKKNNGLSENVSRIVVMCPGKTVRSRLQVLNPRREDNIYDEWQLLPESLRPRLNGVKVDIVNFEKCQLRDGAHLADMPSNTSSKKMNEILGIESGHGRESYDDMWTRVLKLELGTQKERTVVLNDEGHHCWSRTTGQGVWMGALKALRSHPRIEFDQVIDLTATPIFINPSQSLNYKVQNSNDPLFPWIVSEYALIESMESGLVKIPKLPTERQGLVNSELRNLYDACNGKPLSNPQAKGRFREVAQLLYEDYRKTYEQWKERNDPRLGDPVLIVVVNNKKNAEIVYQMLGGHRGADGQLYAPDGFDLLRNVPFTGCSDDQCEIRTILVVSKSTDPEKTEGGVAVEIGKGSKRGSQIGIHRADQPAPTEDEVHEILRTVAQPGKPGSTVRCVVSVGMLTEGWDCQRVTHILGYRKFGSQLLCEQVLGRALRRQDYDNRIRCERKDTDVETRYPAEYATVIGVPFQTWADTGGSEPPPRPPAPIVDVYPIHERIDQCQIWVPVIEDYRLDIEPDKLRLDLEKISREILGFPQVFVQQDRPPVVSGPFGHDTTLDSPIDIKPDHGLWLTAAELARQIDGSSTMAESVGHLRPAVQFAECLRIIKKWLSEYSAEGWCDEVLNIPEARAKIVEALIPAVCSEKAPEIQRRGVVDPRKPWQSASYWKPFSTRLSNIVELEHSELNIAACHSKLESVIAAKIDKMTCVAAITRNHGPERIEIPYRDQGVEHRYVPDFFLRLKSREDRPVAHIVLEVKGIKDEASELKRAWTQAWWIPAANHLGRENDQAWFYLEIGADDNVESQIVKILEDEKLV